MFGWKARRVARGYEETTREDPATQKETVEKGQNIIFDQAFVPLPMVLQGSPSDEAFRALDRRFRLLWAEERTTNVTADFGGVAQAGPFPVRVRLRQSKTPVPLDQVPGLGIPKAPKENSSAQISKSNL